MQGYQEFEKTIRRYNISWKIPLFKIYWDKQDVELVSDAIKQGMNWAIGTNIELFEHMLSEYLGAKYALVFNSGTSALHAAMLAHGIGQGDEVIVPSFTFIATANAPLFVGAKPVFADIEDKTYGLDPDDVKKKITKKTRAIMPIHYGGSPCLASELAKVAEENGLLLIEDAAESLGAQVKGKKVGTFGHSSMLSFCSNKVISTGEGGAIITNSRDVSEKARLIRSHGRLEDSNYFSSVEYLDYVSLGYNFRMSNITAALGIAQLGHLDKLIEMRRKNAAYMTDRLSEINEITPPQSPNDYFHVYQMYTVKLRGQKGTRDRLAKYLKEQGIMTKVYFSPVHLSHFYKKVLGYKCRLPVTEELSEKVLTLPMYPALTKQDIDYIVDNIKAFFGEEGSRDR
ncbi:DegT/DnrJ/EryC1/StrS family aminotransferase [Chloroflexota bacterium]